VIFISFFIFCQLNFLCLSSAVISVANMPLLICAAHLAAYLAALFVTPPPPPSDDGEEELPPPLPVLPHQVVVTDNINVVHHIHWRPFPAVVHPHPPPPRLYANQRDDDPDHPDRQTCNLAGSIGHYRCSPRRPCCGPCPTEEIDITPQCTLPVSATNGHGIGHNIFSWEEDYDGWFERDNAAAAAAADALGAPLWNQADWEENKDAEAAAAALAGYLEWDNNAHAAADALAAPRWNRADWDEQE
jgi:hypothetical protein